MGCFFIVGEHMRFRDKHPLLAQCLMAGATVCDAFIMTAAKAAGICMILRWFDII